VHAHVWNLFQESKSCSESVRNPSPIQKGNKRKKWMPTSEIFASGVAIQKGNKRKWMPTSELPSNGGTRVSRCVGQSVFMRDTSLSIFEWRVEQALVH